MAILDELLRKLKSVTLDKTNLDEKVVNAVRSVPNQFNPSVNNSVANRFWRSNAGNNIVDVQQAPQRSLNKIRYEMNRPRNFDPKFLKTLSDVGYVGTQFARGTEAIPFVGKPISRAIDPSGTSKIADILYGTDRRLRPGTVESGSNVPSSDRVRKVGDIANLLPAGILLAGGARSPSFSSSNILSKLPIGIQKILAVGAPSAGIGALISKAMGGDYATGAKLGFKGAPSVDLVGKFTNPLIEKITAGAYSKVANPLIRQLVARGTTGALNVAEGVPMDLALGNKPLDKVSVMVDLASGVLMSTPANAELRAQITNAVKNLDLSAFENALKVAKEQGQIFNETKLNSLREMLKDQSGFIAPGEFVSKGRSTEDLVELLRSGKGTFDEKSGFVKIRDGSGNLVNAGRLRKDVAREAMLGAGSDEKNLVALHSGRLEGVLNAGKEGKLAMPSIAVTKKDIPLEDFGDTTFVGNKKLVTPGKDMKVYSNDIYSPTIPQPEYDMKGLSPELSKELDARNIYKWDIDSLSKEEFVRRLTEGLPANRDIREQRFYTPEEATKIADEVFGDPVVKVKRDVPSGLTGQLIKRIPSLRKIFDESTSHYDFRLLADNDRETMEAITRYAESRGLDPYEILNNEADYYEIASYNAENLTRKMREHMNIRNQGELRGSEQGWGMSAPSRVMGAKEFKSIEDIKKNTGLLQPEDTVKNTGTAYDEEVTNYLGGLAQKAGIEYDNNHMLYNERELVKEALQYIQKNGSLGKDGLRKLVTYTDEFGRSGFYSGGEDVLKLVDPKKFEKLIRKAYMDIPTEYFEAKALRAVDFSEFDGIIVPKGEIDRVRAELGEKANGLKIVEYDPKKPNDRMNIIQQHFQDSMFGIVPVIEPQYDENGNLTGYKFSPQKTAMASFAVGGLRQIRKGDFDSTMKSINRDPDFKNYGQNAKEMIAQEAKNLADSIQGVEIIPTGDSGRGIRQSMNPPWYRKFYADNGRAPNNKELFYLAEESLRTGKIMGEATNDVDPNELKAINDYLDTEIKGNNQATTPINDILSLPGRQNVPLLQSPKEVITSKKKLLDIFQKSKKTGQPVPDFVNQLKPRTKPIIAGEQQIPTATTGAEARKIVQDYGKMPEVTAKRVTLDEVVNQPGRTIDDRGKKIEEVLYGSATPKQSELGGDREGAGAFSNLLRKGVGMVSDKVGEALSSTNPFVRGTASLLQDFAGNLGKSEAQITKKSQFTGGIDYATKLGSDTQRYVTSLVGNSPETLEKIHAVLDPELAKTQVKYEDLSPAEKEATDFLKYVSDYINETNYKNGFISKDKYLENTGGKYIARAYEPYDFPPELADFMQQRNQKLDLDPFKQRGDVTEWKQENAVRDPAYLVGKRLQQTLFNDNFRSMANWLGTTDLVSNTPKPGYVQVSDHKAYGDMAGKYIRKDALEDIKGFFFSNQTAQKAYDMLNWWDRLAPRRLRKRMLTVFNPAVRLGNNVGNYVFAWFNGINPVTFSTNRNWAKDAIKTNDPLYRRAIQDGLLGSDVTRGDIQRYASELKSGVEDQNILKKIDQVLSDSYGRVDDLAKLSALKTHLDRGFSYDEAFKRVYNGFQNYNAVGFLYDIGAKVPILGNPFVRFKADVVRMMKNAVVDHPIRTAGTLFAWKLFTDVSSFMSGESEEDRETRESRLGAPRVPFTDISLAVQTPWGEVNASRLIGLYAMNQLGESGGTSDVADYLPFEAPSMKNIGTDPLIGGLLSVAVDTDFRGKKISDPDANKYTGSTLTDEEKNANRLKYLARSYNLPTLNDVSDIGSAVKGEPNFYGQKRTPLQAILRTAGLKVEQYGAPEAQLARDKNDMYAMNAIESEQRKISQIRNQLSRGEVSESDATRRIQAIEGNIAKMQSKMGGGDSNVGGATVKTGVLPETRVKSLNNIFGMDRVTSMPEKTNYEKAQKKAEQFTVIDKVLDSDFLSTDEQESYLSQVTDFKKEEIGYYRVAKGSADERYGFVLDKLESDSADKMKLLATMRYEIDEKKVLTNNLIDRLEDEGYISDAQAKMLKKLEYNQNTGKVSNTGSGSSSSKLAKEIAKLNRESTEDLQKMFEDFSQATVSKRRGSARSILQITNKINAPSSVGSRRIEDVLSSKRAIKPTAKIG